MKIVFLSNFFNHHQRMLSHYLHELTDGNFFFIESMTMDDERLKLGWGESFIPDYVISYENNIDYCRTVIDEADVLIFGSAPQKYLLKRIIKNKLIFKYTERPIKKNNTLLKNICRFFVWRVMNPQKKKIYLLCASAFAAADYAKFGLYKNKTYKWGYFPETKQYDIDALIRKKNADHILWCGRFIDWKHPDDVIEIAAKLKKEGYNFRITMIGNGEMKELLCDRVLAMGLDDIVHIAGSMTPEQVRIEMENSGIYLFTSDHQEGWGAVLNEAMNSGCAVIASHAIGSVPFLLEHEKNGIIYESGNISDLLCKVRYLLDNINEQKRLGKQAYHTVVEKWNAKTASERFIRIAQQIDKSGYSDLYEEGPCSRAPISSNDWFMTYEQD